MTAVHACAINGFLGLLRAFIEYGGGDPLDVAEPLSCLFDGKVERAPPPCGKSLAFLTLSFDIVLCDADFVPTPRKIVRNELSGGRARRPEARTLYGWRSGEATSTAWPTCSKSRR